MVWGRGICLELYNIGVFGLERVERLMGYCGCRGCSDLRFLRFVGCVMDGLDYCFYSVFRL